MPNVALALAPRTLPPHACALYLRVYLPTCLLSTLALLALGSLKCAL